jgi:hypothetical protein
MTQKQIKAEILKYNFAMRPGEINDYTKNVYNFLKVKKQTGASAVLGTKEVKTFWASSAKVINTIILTWERGTYTIGITDDIDEKILKPILLNN